MAYDLHLSNLQYKTEVKFDVKNFYLWKKEVITSLISIKQQQFLS
jgi:hypothetical protein